MDKQQKQAWVIASSLFVILFFVWGATYNTTPLSWAHS